MFEESPNQVMCVELRIVRLHTMELHTASARDDLVDNTNFKPRGGHCCETYGGGTNYCKSSKGFRLHKSRVAIVTKLRQAPANRMKQITVTERFE